MSYHIGKRTGETELCIRGWEMIRFIDRQKEAGYHQVIWNGQDKFGHSLASAFLSTGWPPLMTATVGRCCC